MSDVTLDRTRAPQPGPLPKVAFPPFAEHTLKNGLKVYIVENHEQPLATVVLYVRAGSVLDNRSQAGVASVTAEMLMKGTTHRNALQIADEIDFVGGSLNASSSWDSTTISLTILTKYLSSGLELFSDIILNPTFPTEELDRLRLQRIAAIKQAKADANYLADSTFSKVVFPNHPYGGDAGGTEASIEAMKVEEIKAFHQTYFGPDNAFLVAAGDVAIPEFLSSLEQLLGAWKPVNPPTQNIKPAELQPAVQVALVEKPAAVQSAIRVGHVGVERDNDDFIRLYVLNMLLGGYFNSRINLNLREKHGFTYGARSFFDARVQPGPFAVSTEVQTGVTARAIEEILSELRRITLEEVTDEELKMVKNYIIGSFPLQLETPQQIAGRVAMIVLYGLPKNYYDTYRDKVSMISTHSLLTAAQKYLHPDRISIVVSGDTAALSGALTQFGEIRMYSPEGEVLSTVVPA